VGGSLATSDESLELRFFAQDSLPELLPIERRVIADAFAGKAGVFLV
jgi:hypothetical protein